MNGRRVQAIPTLKLLLLLGVLLGVCTATVWLAAGCGAAGVPSATVTGSSATTPSSNVSSGPGPSSRGTSVTDITIPPPGSPNLPIYQALGWDNVYVLYWLQIEDGWAYAHGIPFTTTDGPTIDTRALLREDGSGRWQVLEKSTSEGLLTDVGQVAEDQAIPEQFRSKHARAPAGIFPEVKPQDLLLMDAVRAALGNPSYRFNVFLLNSDNDWAYTELRALAYRTGHIVESRDERALLRRVNGVWTVQQMENMDGDTESDFIATLKQRYPEVPASVLP